MQLIALQQFDYDGKTRRPDDVFEAPDLHARLFIQSKRARAIEKKEKPTAKGYQTATVTAEKETKPHDPNARYKRRDMRPEE